MGKQTLWSLLIFIALFLVLALIEWLAPQLQGQLLKWSDPAFIVGIPASIIGVAYVRTIKNPQNYMGFYLGILMSLLLACQFYLQKNYDLVFLYIAVFLPFLISSLVTWRRATLAPFAHEAPFKPAFLSTGKMVLTHVICALILAGDYVLVSCLHGFATDATTIIIRLMAAMMISSSFFANFYLIYKKNDAWLCWVIYSVAGILLNIAVGNLFSIVLFTVFLLVNGNAAIAWIKATDISDYGWFKGCSGRKCKAWKERYCS